MRPLAFALAALFAATAYAGQAQEKVPAPQDQDKLYLTVFGVPGETQFEEIRSMIRSPKLAGFASQTHYREVAAGSAIFNERFATTLRELPCVRMQDPEGRVLYQTSGANVPNTSEELATHLFRCRPRRQQPSQPAPQPEPVTPQFETLPISDIAPPDTIEPPPEEESGPNLAAIIAALVVGGGGALVRNWKNSFAN